MKALATQDAQGMSPLHCAAMFDHPHLVTYLINEVRHFLLIYTPQVMWVQYVFLLS